MAHRNGFVFDQVKIGRLFTSSLTHRSGGQVAAHAIEAVAHGLGDEVCFEGIESAEQETMVTTAGCPVLQGHHYSRAMAPAEIDALLGISVTLEDEPALEDQPASSASVARCSGGFGLDRREPFAGHKGHLQRRKPSVRPLAWAPHGAGIGGAAEGLEQLPMREPRGIASPVPLFGKKSLSFLGLEQLDPDHDCPLAIASDRILGTVMCGRLRLRKVGFELMAIIAGSGHVSGLFARRF